MRSARFTTDAAGIYSVQFGFSMGAPTSFYVGKPADSIDDTYTFNIEE